ncbi:permeability factor 2-like [Alligator sinensis]|uniref:Permeability factor 2-like n=1 Tax=Alligator sinensis TaxID=38654 RepID=A0A3Q0GW04_ALLSI|nr:permeability factor 2-like [Alligator sinensis]
MKSLATVLVIALLVKNLIVLEGLPLESLLTYHRCKCLKETSNIIRLTSILSINVMPPGIHCRKKEIILTLKGDKKVCVNPSAPWIQALLQHLTQRKALQNSSKQVMYAF